VSKCKCTSSIILLFLLHIFITLDSFFCSYNCESWDERTMWWLSFGRSKLELFLHYLLRSMVIQIHFDYSCRSGYNRHTMRVGISRFSETRAAMRIILTHALWQEVLEKFMQGLVTLDSLGEQRTSRQMGVLKILPRIRILSSFATCKFNAQLQFIFHFRIAWCCVCGRSLVSV